MDQPVQMFWQLEFAEDAIQGTNSAMLQKEDDERGRGTRKTLVYARMACRDFIDPKSGQIMAGKKFRHDMIASMTDAGWSSPTELEKHSCYCNKLIMARWR